MERDEDLKENSNVSNVEIFFPFWKVKKQEITPSSSSSTSSSNILERSRAITNIVFGEVLDIILKNSDTRDLYSLRRVNRSWSRLASRILLQRKDNEMEFTFCATRSQYFRQSRLNMCLECSAQSGDGEPNSPQLNIRSLRDFTSYLGNYNNTADNSKPIFPCVRFRFNGGHLNSPDAQHFFNKYGKLVKGLCLDMDADVDLNGDGDIQATDKRTLINIIFHKLPNLESLNIASLPRLWEITEREEDEPPQRQRHVTPAGIPGLPRLLNLTHLEIGETSVNLFGAMSHLLQTIMNSSPNIQEIYFSESFTPNFLQLFLSPFPSRLHLLRVHSLNLNLFQDHPRFLEELSHCEFALKSINLDVKDARVFSETDETRKERGISRRVSSLSRVLARSALSMDHLGLLSGALKFLMKIPVPIFPSVKSLYLDFRNASSLKLPSQYFPPCPVWTNLPLVFPQLSEVTMDVGLGLNMSSSRSCGADPNFPCWNKQEVTSVKKLSVLGYPSPRTVENLTRIFPHVETLTVSDVTDFPKTANSMWKLKRLKHLKLQCVTDAINPDYQFPAFDEGFTGFGRETLLMLKEADNLDNVDLKTLNELRAKKSMLDLQDLESVDVKFVNWEGHSLDSAQFLSDITIKCVFKRMNNLEWNIHSNNPPHEDEGEDEEI